MENLDTTANNFFEVASNYTWIVVIAALIVEKKEPEAGFPEF